MQLPEDALKTACALDLSQVKAVCRDSVQTDLVLTG